MVPHRSRRSGVVLILVVALLAVLFVAGAALLNTVTFSTKTLTAEKDDRQQRAAADAAIDLVVQRLREGWLSDDGIPYSAEGISYSDDPFFRSTGTYDPALYRSYIAQMGTVLTPTGPYSAGSVFNAKSWRVRLPAYGEIVGTHTWLDFNEPVEPNDSADPDRCEVPLYSNIRLAMNHQATIDPVYTDGQIKPTLYEALPLNNLAALPAELHAMDADGDDIPDSLALEVVPGDGIFPPEVQRRLADMLRDPQFVNYLGSGGSLEHRNPDTLWLVMKVIDHGAMINLNTRVPLPPAVVYGGAPCTYPDYFDVLVSSLLGRNPDGTFAADGKSMLTIFQNAPYLPLSEEGLLRSRMCVVPRNRAMTSLASDLTMDLLKPHSMLTNPTIPDLQDSSKRQWWPYDTSDLNKRTNKWRTRMYPGSGVGKYELNHVATTTSYDDNLIRGGRSSGADWVNQMLTAKDSGGNLRFPEMQKAPGNDARIKGRLKFSFGHFGKILTAGGGLPATNATTGFAYPANEFVRLDDLDAPTRDDLAKLIQDQFFLMLRNYTGIVDFNGDGQVDPPGIFGQSALNSIDDNYALSLTAAALTANLIDFADANDVPTLVKVRDWRTGEVITNNSEPIEVYGVERQPYITEVYGKVGVSDSGTCALDANNTSFAIELYNPYDVPLSLDGYTLTDATSPLITPFAPPLNDVGGQPAVRLNELAAAERSLNGKSIPARSFFVVKHNFFPLTNSPTGNNVMDLGIASSRIWALDQYSRIQLLRNVGGREVVVDEFDIGSDTWRGVGVPQSPWNLGHLDCASATSGTIELDWERDSTLDTTDNPPGGVPHASLWRFTVPRAAERRDRKPEGHTLGKPSEYDSAQDVDTNGNPDPIRAVQVDFANSGDLRTAFPTTGTMLLLMRHAHVMSLPNIPEQPFNRMLERRDLNPYRPGAMAAEYYKIDNGHMPVFDAPVRPNEMAGDGASLRHRMRPAPGTAEGAQQGIEALPWGQLVFDYFTALPLDTEPFWADPQTLCDPLLAGWPRHQPPVDMQGVRVAGRININTAPWSVLAGLPSVPLKYFTWSYPADATKQSSFHVKFGQVLTQSPEPTHYYDTNSPGYDAFHRDANPVDIGREVAQAIVGYRNASVIPNPAVLATMQAASYAQARSPEIRPPIGQSKLFRQGYGFLTVGELLNVRSLTDEMTDWYFWMDAGEVSKPNGTGDYVRAVARMVALSDWVTTKSSVFTIYGTIRGAFIDDPANAAASQASLKAVDQRAIRFQTTIDRMPTLYGDAPQRIGARVLGGYSDVRGE